jgi:ankyrin repeat protein
VECQLKSLCKEISPKAIRKALENVPVGLYETYIRIFDRIKFEYPDQIDTIKNIFYWLVHSLRPLKAAELAEAVMFDTSQDEMDFSAIPTELEDLLQYCGGLVNIDSGRTIGLAHSSIKEFLLSSIIQRSTCSEFFAGSESVKAGLADTCISYLAMKDFAAGQSVTTKRFIMRLERYKFLQYASHYWTDHYTSISEGSAKIVDEKVFNFFISASAHNNVLAWQQVESIENYSIVHQTKKVLRKDEWGCEAPPVPYIVSRQTPMYDAAFYGLWNLTQRLLDAGYDINSSLGCDKFPICVASWEGKASWKYLSKLVKAGANFNNKTFDGTVAFANAFRGGPEDWWLLQDLVIAGIDINARSENYYGASTVLETISQHPSDPAEMVQFLVDHGADINGSDVFSEDRSGERGPFTEAPDAECSGPPLQQSCYAGNARVTEVLLKSGARINFSDCEHGSPVQAAIHGHHEELVPMLLASGADINAKGGALGSPLQAAAWAGNVDLVKNFLQIGANVNLDGGCYGSSLTVAIAQGHSAIVDLLLKHNSAVNGGNPEIAFRWLDHLETTTLLERPSKLPINWALKLQNEPLVRRLIERGADLNQPDGRCQASNDFVEHHPLCVGIMSKNTPMVALLLSNGAMVSNGNYCALLTAAFMNHQGLFKQLLGEVSIDQDLERIFLAAFTLCSSEEFIQFLITIMASRSIRFQPYISGLLLSSSLTYLESQNQGQVQDGI